MGRDPRAMLFYGIAYNEDDELPEDISDKEWEFTHAARQAAVPQPSAEWDHERAAKDSEYDKEWDDWRTRCDEWEKEQCDLRIRGSCGDPQSIVYVNESYKSVEWDETLEVSTDRPEQEWQKWDEKLKAYCDALGLPWRKPAWLLASYYG